MNLRYRPLPFQATIPGQLVNPTVASAPTKLASGTNGVVVLVNCKPDITSTYSSNGPLGL